MKKIIASSVIKIDEEREELFEISENLFVTTLEGDTYFPFENLKEELLNEFIGGEEFVN